MNRRNFFSNLFNGIVATQMAPSIIIPIFADRQIYKMSRVIKQPKYLKYRWVPESEQDLLHYHSITTELPMTGYIQNEIDMGIMTILRSL
jgi:hypothetical protein